ncbi:MAG TPA: putative sulfate exporter family transporter [Desulfuromonadaceae bacterium]
MNTGVAKKWLFAVLVAGCACPRVGTAAALIGGMLFSLLLGNPWPAQSAAWSKRLLQVSVVGLGFGLSLGDVAHAGRESFVYTVIGISMTLTMGYLLGRVLKTGTNTSLLISFGTAICGGSAIAAMAPVVRAKNEEIAVALATVFALNSLALLLFPLVGRGLHLDQALFGTWAGLAIHDTSSVVGAAAAFGPQALAVGTTVKLARAIWITPIVIVTGWLKGSDQKAAVPLFIIGFVAAATIRTLLPQFSLLWGGLSAVARQSLVVTLFLIGAGLSRDTLRTVGARPLAQAVMLWAVVSTLTLGALLMFGLA